MNVELLQYCHEEIQELLQKKKRKDLYDQVNHPEQGVPRLVINYKPLNSILEWIRYRMPNKKDLINQIQSILVFSNFDMKSKFWQIQITVKDKYKTTFNVSFGQYEWNVISF